MLEYWPREPYSKRFAEMEHVFVLFDIDGTLISLDGAGSRSLNRAMEDLLGIPNGFRHIDFAGKTDFQIIREGLQKFDLLDRDDLPDSLLARYLDHLRNEVTMGRGHVKEGVNELLHTVRGLKGFYLGLLTGNVEAGARLKLDTFDLNHFFPVGGFGDDSEDRNLLLPFAVKRLLDSESIALEYEQCVVIGDTPKDVECAQVHGACSIAVATGTHSLEQLKNTTADLVLSDLSNTEHIVEWLCRRAG
ncbi:MAG: HAD hydrolase-like protein [Deltaproteobacteria bacterium]|nr:HAD hydrolase-like protein [Deltaproteobacteria bacterium]